ncbi:MAG: hypothetical protein AAF916_09860 [Planctomycetota bacterium]
MDPALRTPTDNLYKFIAVAGLAIFIVTLVFMFRRAEQINQRWFDTSVRLAEAGAVDFEMPSTLPADPMQRAIIVERQTILKAAEDFKVLATDWLAKAIFGSGAMAVLGLGLWWWNTQSWQDRLIRLQVEAQEKSVPNVATKAVRSSFATRRSRGMLR